MFKFLPGLLIVEVVAGALTIVAAGSAGGVSWVLAALIAVTVTLVVGLWFASIAAHLRKDAIADLREAFTKDRETLLVSAEAEKRIIVEESHRRIVEETARAHARANFKLGAAVVGLVGVAGVLLYVELFTLALVTMSTAGGALAGYLARARQDVRALRHGSQVLNEASTGTLIPSSAVTPPRTLSYQPQTRKSAR